MTSAIKSIDLIEGVLVCCGTCENEAFFSVRDTDMEEVEALALDSQGWGETGRCPVCERSRAAEDRGDSDRKAIMEGSFAR